MAGKGKRPVTPLLAVDAVVFDKAGRIVLIRRRNPPFAGGFALPGGFVDVGESVEDACRRELSEETGVKVGRLHLVGVYSDPGRDPRGHTVAVAYMASARSSNLAAGDDAADAHWVTNWRSLQLAFDHARILADAVRLRKALAGS